MTKEQKILDLDRKVKWLLVQKEWIEQELKEAEEAKRVLEID